MLFVIHPLKTFFFGCQSTAKCICQCHVCQLVVTSLYGYFHFATALCIKSWNILHLLKIYQDVMQNPCGVSVNFTFCKLIRP